MHTLKEFAARAVEMPAMPEVAQRLLRSFDREDLGLQEVADLIGRDPALAAKMLRLANSARYSPSHTVASVKDAAMMLGLTTLRDLTLSACMAGAMPSPAGFDRLRHWRGSMALAGYSQAVAHAMAEDQDVAYIAGLMLRSGQLLMALVDVQVSHEVEVHLHDPDDRIGWEQTLFGCSHPAISAELASHWHFPTLLVQAFRSAADPMEVRPFNRLGAMLRIASVVTDLRESGLPVAEGLKACQGPLLDHLGLDPVWLESQLPSHDQLVEGVNGLLH